MAPARRWKRGEDVRVLQSHRAPRPTTNPYITTLYQELRAEPGLSVESFTFRRAILKRYDVFHAHWPEVMMASDRLSRRLPRELLTAAFLTRLSVTRTPVVRTVHNLELPSGLSLIQRWLLKRFDELTVLRIVLNEQTTHIVDGPTAIVLHGDYRNRYEDFEPPAPVEGRIGYVGLVRRYKGVERLVEAFCALPGDDLTLRIAGKPSSDELAQEVDAIAVNDERIQTRWEFLSDADLAHAVSESELVVLPYRHMHNSGAALTALSLARPVLVPNTAVNRDLAAEVGPGWVMMFDGHLGANDLAAALAAARETGRAATPDLSRRDWGLAAPAHLRAYRRALALARQ